MNIVESDVKAQPEIGDTLTLLLIIDVTLNRLYCVHNYFDR